LQEGSVHSRQPCDRERFGAFVDIGGRGRLLHVSALATAAAEAADASRLARRAGVKISKTRAKKRTISLGLKQLAGPLEAGRPKKFRQGHAPAWQVARVADFGAFVRTGKPGLEGLIPRSEMSWTSAK